MAFLIMQYEERLGKERFQHAADAVRVVFLCWVLPESQRDVVWTTVVDGMYSVTHSWEQEEVTHTQCLCCKHSVSWWRHRIILTLQDQRRKHLPDSSADSQALE